jgi:hypothetical protein
MNNPSRVSESGITTLSPGMRVLHRKALDGVRDSVADKFRDPVDLENLPKLIVETQKKLGAAEARLNGAVQGKLDALKRSVDLMDESSVKLSDFSDNMRKVDERITQSNTTISMYENLKRVHHVRDNLSKVLTQVEYFARIPEKEEKLRELLMKDRSKLKEVFLESLKLDSLRIALLNEMNENDKKVRGFVDHYLSVVPVLAADVAKRALENISGVDQYSEDDDFFALASKSPADLVMTFEVLQMHQEYYNRRKDQVCM